MVEMITLPNVREHLRDLEHVTSLVQVSCTIFYVRETQFTIIPLQGFWTPSVSGKQNFFLRVQLSNHHLTDKTEVIKSHLIIKGSNAFPIGKP